MKEVKYVLAWLIGFNTLVLDAQTLSGNFTSMAGEWVRFGTFQGIQSPVLDSARIDVNGAFSLPSRPINLPLDIWLPRRINRIF